ncbi:MAG TPA: hypothetical protein VJI33_03240 [Candidatus Paceibacterota bacterium]
MKTTKKQLEERIAQLEAAKSKLGDEINRVHEERRNLREENRELKGRIDDLEKVVATRREMLATVNGRAEGLKEGFVCLAHALTAK